jgi:hypothetical protein
MIGMVGAVVSAALRTGTIGRVVTGGSPAVEVAVTRVGTRLVSLLLLLVSLEARNVAYYHIVNTFLVCSTSLFHILESSAVARFSSSGEVTALRFGGGPGCSGGIMLKQESKARVN